MPTLNALVEVEVIMEALDLVDLPDECRYKPTSAISMEVSVSQDAIDAQSSDPEEVLIRIEPDHRDLRDGLRALVDRDFAMASVLLIRAFDDVDPEAQRIVEEECRAAARKRAA